MDPKCFFCGVRLTRENEPEGVIIVREDDLSVPCCTPDWRKRRELAVDTDYRTRKAMRRPWDARS